MLFKNQNNSIAVNETKVIKKFFRQRKPQNWIADI